MGLLLMRISTLDGLAHGGPVGGHSGRKLRASLRAAECRRRSVCVPRRRSDPTARLRDEQIRLISEGWEVGVLDPADRTRHRSARALRVMAWRAVGDRDHPATPHGLALGPRRTRWWTRLLLPLLPMS